MSLPGECYPGYALLPFARRRRHGMNRIVSAGAPQLQFATIVPVVRQSLPRAHLSPVQFIPSGARGSVPYWPRVGLTLFGQPWAGICFPFREQKSNVQVTQTDPNLSSYNPQGTTEARSPYTPSREFNSLYPPQRPRRGVSRASVPIPIVHERLSESRYWVVVGMISHPTSRTSQNGWLALFRLSRALS